MLKLESVAAFVAVAEARSISEAARRMELSKSVVSERLAELERTLGAKLLHRTTRKIAITEDESAFYERAKRIVEQNREPLQRIAEALLEREVLEADEVAKLVRGEQLEPFESARRPAEEEVRETADRRAKEDRRRAPKETPISTKPLKTPGQA